ncbi:hypothetical protein [Methylophilus sp.]|jgi:hypothetical protein|uniref:hypothetical protein n=1 Tax=Methylophilus sp. TaxID=29541 RepID=UPI004036C386
MVNKIDEISEGIYLTPSTRKLMQLRKGKGLGMLNDEEIELLRMSKREVSIGTNITFQTMINSAERPGYIGSLSYKTIYKATIEEIQKAIQNRWANDDLKRKS